MNDHFHNISKGKYTSKYALVTVTDLGQSALTYLLRQYIITVIRRNKGHAEPSGAID